MREPHALGDPTASLARWLPDALLVIDGEARIVYANPAAERLFGYGPGELDDRPVDQLLPTVHVPQPVCGAAEPAEGLRHDGTRFPAEVVLGPLPTADGEHTVATVRDASHRPERAVTPGRDGRRRDSAGASAAWLWEILDLLPDAMLVVGARGALAVVNQAACGLFGYERDELVGRPLEQLVPHAARAAHQGHLEQYLRAPRLRPMGSGLELHALRRDGTTVPVDISLAPFETGGERLVIAAVRDISDRKRAEEALRESRERFDLALRGTDAGIWDWDLRTDTLFFSDRWKSMLGYAPDEIPGHFDEWQGRLHPDDRERALATVEAYFSGRSAEYELEHRLRHKDGTYRWILARGAAVRDASGRFYRMVGSHIDVTARRVAEETVRRHQAELVAGATIQRFLLPHESPRVDGLEVAGCCYPAEYTAGDYYDYLYFPDGTLGVMVADVTGHGLGPAIVAASCHSCIQSLTESLSEPGEMLARLNARVYHETNAELLVSLVVARIDPARRTLTCYNAGHPAVVVLDASGAVRASLAAENLPLGVLPELAFVPGPTVVLNDGDLVLLYTDGVTEAHPDGDTTQFELDRALAVVSAHRDRPAREIAEQIHRAVCRHIGTDRLRDDVTVVVIKVSGGPCDRPG